ncbi:hypothetical protein ARSQ2_00477 [Arsenophonus endosymbiont of Bemisia tabaci Q2]|nr:hypothetical protein ARSQ2_00477 [Arsenophonus endosymbiont of Bemisia tabaci Q2]
MFRHIAQMPATRGITALKRPKKRPIKRLHTPQCSKKDDLDQAFQDDGKLATYGVRCSYYAVLIMKAKPIR